MLGSPRNEASVTLKECTNMTILHQRRSPLPLHHELREQPEEPGVQPKHTQA